MENVVIYARVSTNAQDYQRQLDELRCYAQKHSYNVVREFAETISGAKKVADRAAMTELLEFVESNTIDKILVYECSRLSRRIVDFLSIVEHLNEMKVSLFIMQSGLETLQPDKTINPIAQMVLGMMAQFNSMERGLIRSRMESGYNHYREQGGKVGRKEGYRKTDDAMRQQYGEEIKLLRKGYSLRNIVKLTGTSVNTLRKIKNII